MDIFENLENLEISEECFNDIMGIVEEIIDEEIIDYIKKVHGDSEKGKELTNKALSNIGTEVTSAINRKVNKVNPKAFYTSKKSPEKVKKEFINREREKLSNRRYTNKNSVGAAKTDVRRASTEREALENRIERNNKEYDNFRNEKSIKRNAVKKLQDYMRGRKSVEPKVDLSDKLKITDKSHPINTKRGLGDFTTHNNQVMKDENLITDNRYKDKHSYETNSAKYRPEVKSIARNMKKQEKDK